MSSAFELKHQLIVEAAIEVFLESGFSGTSVDKVAQRAGMSKVTVYNHFKDKKELFEKVMEIHCQNLRKNVPQLEFSKNSSLEQNLSQLAENIVTGLLAPKSIALMRVVIFETGQFPELGKLIWVDGKLPLMDHFCTYLKFENEHQRLKIEDPYLAARQFFGMIKENLVWPALMGLELNSSPKFRKDVIQNSVGMFLGYYKRV